MSTKDNIHIIHAKDSLVSGIRKARTITAGTYGPKGYSVIVEDILFPGHMVADDSYSILKKIKLGDKIEQRGIELLKESVDKSRKELGDSTTATVLLTSETLEEGLKLNVYGREIKDSLDACLPIIEKYIDENTIQIQPEEVGKVAFVASGDRDISNTLQEIYTKIGKEGIVELDASQTTETHYDIVEGVKLRNAGFMYSYMTNDGQGRKATLESPKILITKQKLNVLKDLDSVMEQFMKMGGGTLVIFCEDIDVKVSEALAASHQQGLLKVLVIKSPSLWKDWLFEDFSKITGATIIDPSQGTHLMRFKAEMFGTCGKIISYHDETIVIGTQDITEHIKNLEEKGKEDDQQVLRASWLQTKTAILKIGANSESELALKRLKIENGRNSAHLALKGGIIIGGGMALFNASKLMPDTLGGNILKKALLCPVRQLFINSSQEFNPELIGGNTGFNADSGKIEDLVESEVFDPAISVKGSIVNAVRLASTVLTSNGVITLDNE